MITKTSLTPLFFFNEELKIAPIIYSIFDSDAFIIYFGTCTFYASLTPLLPLIDDQNSK